MMKKVHSILIIFLLILPCCRKSDENRNMLDVARKKYTFVNDFVNSFSEEKLIIVMNFINNPDKYFDAIKKIPRLFAYFEVLDRLAETDEKYDEMSFVSFLDNNFNEGKLTEKKVNILTFLLLNSKGYFGEILADKYSKLFSKFTDVFISYLSKRSDWKRIVNLLGAGDWQVFKTSAEKLGDSGFEGEFKRFVLAPIDKEGKRNIK